MKDDTDWQRRRDEAAEKYQTDYVRSDRPKTYDEIKNAVIFGADLGRAEGLAELERIKNAPFYKTYDDVVKDRDKWKDEYENVCKFATDYEQQRDQLREQLRVATDTLESLIRLGYMSGHGDNLAREALRTIGAQPKDTGE